MGRVKRCGPAGQVASILAVAAVAGSSAMGQTNLLHLAGSAAGDRYGRHLESVSAGFTFSPVYLLVVGVPDDDTNGTDAGRVDVRSATNGSVLYTRYGAAAGDRFGISIAQGDLNGDGRVDYLIIGADQDG